MPTPIDARISIRKAAGGLILTLAAGTSAFAQTPPPEPPEFPPFADVSKGFEKVVSTQDGQSWYSIWKRSKDQQLLAELPKDFEAKRFFITPTVSAGDLEAGVYPNYTRWGSPGERYAYWTRVRNRLMLVEPNLQERTTGDQESKLSTQRVFTDRVVLETPILTIGPGGGPVIDLDAMLLGASGKFFGYFTHGLNAELTKIAEVKSFPRNVEIAFTAPVRDGQLVTIHYSISTAQPTPSFKVREADRRVGFFYVNFTDKAKNDGESQTVRYATRWNLEKADPKLKLSPPKAPIIYYIEHTTPVRYRRWVREGILEWNKAFEKVGIVGAIEVYQQDATTGEHMDKDPEDARYNFLRWTNANMGYAIGPSRVIPETGEIIDADVVMDEGFISGWAREVTQVFPEAMVQGFDADTLDWLDKNPDCDPRVRLAPPQEREQVIARLAAAKAAPATPAAEPSLLRQAMGGGPRSCSALRGSTAQVALARLALSADLLESPSPENAEEAQALDGLPEWYIGPLLKYIVMHEVGHTMGLMHNFKASSIYTLEQITSPEWKGKKPIAGSVMEYLPSNILPGGRDQQGDVAMIGLGSYDYWAIEWGYSSGDPKEIAKRAAEPELAFTSDEGTIGPDPQARVWDMGADGLEWARRQVVLVEELRARLLDRVVKDGQSWQKVRDGYMLLFSKQIGALATAASWIGGDSIAHDRRGDPNGRDPVTVVPAEKQRAAMKFVIENGLREESFGITPTLLAKFGVDSWGDENFADMPDFPAHDTVLGAQATVLTLLMNPTRLRRVMDNEMRTPAAQDMVTIPEVLGAVRVEVWSDLSKSGGNFTARQPMISSFRRNLQREHLNRLVSLTTNGGWPGASSRPLTTLVRQELGDLKTAIDKVPLDKTDPYTRAHLADASERISRALDAKYIQTN